MSAVMTDDELDYLHATTFGDGHLRLIREHKELRAKAKAADQMYEALKIASQGANQDLRLAHGKHARWEISDAEYDAVLARKNIIDAALKAASGEQE